MTDVLYLVQGRQLLCDWLFKVHDCSSYVTLYGSTSTTQKSRRVQWNSTKSSTVPCTNLFTLISLMQISGKQRPVLSLAFFRLKCWKLPFLFFLNIWFSALDDVLLSYITGVLEDLGSPHSVEENFDVEVFAEMLEAYIPGFAEIDR